jgi:stage V sporulation protein G
MRQYGVPTLELRMKITDVAIQLAPRGQDRLRGYCCITIDGSFVVRDIKIISGPHGLFVAMPSRKVMASCLQCHTKNHLHSRFCNQCGSPFPSMIPTGDRVKMHCDVAHPISAECRQTIEKEILNAFGAELHRAQQPGYVSRQIGDGGDAIAPTEFLPPHANPPRSESS